MIIGEGPLRRLSLPLLVLPPPRTALPLPAPPAFGLFVPRALVGFGGLGRFHSQRDGLVEATPVEADGRVSGRDGVGVGL